MGRKNIVDGEYYSLHIRVTKNLKDELVEQSTKHGVLYSQYARQLIMKGLSRGIEHTKWLMNPISSKFKKGK